MKRVQQPTGAVPQLTAEEIRIALAFRNFKPNTKALWVQTMENIARNYQAEVAAARPARVLRLVSGGAA